MLIEYSNNPWLAQRLERALKEAGDRGKSRALMTFEHHKISRRMSAAKIDALVREYVDGFDTPWLAQRYGISKSAVKRLLHEHGVSLRRQSMTSAEASQAAKQQACGVGIAAIATDLGYSESTIRRVLRKR